MSSEKARTRVQLVGVILVTWRNFVWLITLERPGPHAGMGKIFPRAA